MLHVLTNCFHECHLWGENSMINNICRNIGCNMVLYKNALFTKKGLGAAWKVTHALTRNAMVVRPIVFIASLIQSPSSQAVHCLILSLFFQSCPSAWSLPVRPPRTISRRSRARWEVYRWCTPASPSLPASRTRGRVWRGEAIYLWYISQYIWKHFILRNPISYFW